ncbi:MAG: LLM class flavin-dependent oxidoreductase [Candidatus Dormiibacterota bacterium]
MKGTSRLGLAGVIDIPLELLARRAQRLEELGFDQMWLPDERLTRNVYVGLALAARATNNIGLGVGVTNPYTRNPAHTAAAVATLDELSGGRMTLGFGAGGDLSHYGLEKVRPVRAIREAVQIARGLCSGGELAYSGELFSTIHAHLGFQPVRCPPIYIAARGPQILSLAGEIADGAIIGGFSDQAGLRYAKARIAAGLGKSKRTWDAIETVAWLYFSMSEEPDVSRNAVRRIVMASIITSHAVLDQIGVVLPTGLQTFLNRRRWVIGPEELVEASNLLEEAQLNAFAVFGTPDECLAKLTSLAVAPVNQLALVPYPPGGDGLDSYLEILASEFLPTLRTSLGVQATMESQ